MAANIQISVDEHGKGCVKVNGDELPDAAEVLIHSRAGQEPQVWIRVRSRVDGKVSTKDLRSDAGEGILTILQEIQKATRSCRLLPAER